MTEYNPRKKVEKLNTQAVRRVSDLFTGVMNIGDVRERFDVKCGGNAVILRPRETGLNMFCIKSPINQLLAPLVAEHNRKFLIAQGWDDFDEQTQMMLSGLMDVDQLTTDSVRGDIVHYQQIIQCPELVPHVPQFYYPHPTSMEAASAPYIIMEYIEGEDLTVDLASCDKTGEFYSLYKKFISRGFEFGDWIEIIREHATGRLVVVDLDGIGRADSEPS